MLDIQVLHMKYALEVAHTGSISSAARNLYISQPNLSRSLREFEENLGIQMFIRTTRGVTPTKCGQLVLDAANDILQRLDCLEKQITECQENRASLTISLPRATYITCAFSTFLNSIQNASEIKINFSETNRNEAIDNIIRMGFDLGIIRYTEPYDDNLYDALTKKSLSYREVLDDTYRLLMSCKHPLASKEEIYLSDLKNYTELVHGDEDYQTINPDGDTSKRIFLYERGSQFDFLRSVPGTYMWVSPIPELFLKSHELVQRSCKDSKIHFKDLLIYHSGYHLSSYAKEFLKALEEVKSKL